MPKLTLALGMVAGFILTALSMSGTRSVDVEREEDWQWDDSLPALRVNGKAR